MPPFTIESGHPNAVETALLRGLEEQNDALQLHVAWLSSELARSTADEAAARENLALATARFNPSSPVSLEEVRALQARIAELSGALETSAARAHAAELRVSALQSTLMKREDQVMQLSVQLGRAAAHIKEQASAVAGWSERQPPKLHPLPSDLTAAKFAMQQRLIAELTQQLDEARREAASHERASDIWEARHMMWEQAVEASASARSRRHGHLPRRGAEDSCVDSAQATLRTESSLLEAERAWQERCELQRRREAAI